MADGTALYQLEVKLPSGSDGESRTQVVRLKGEENLKFSTRFDFPNIGESGKLYIATDENKTYRWDSESIAYYCVGSDYNDIKIIDCGGAGGDSSTPDEGETEEEVANSVVLADNQMLYTNSGEIFVTKEE